MAVEKLKILSGFRRSAAGESINGVVEVSLARSELTVEVSRSQTGTRDFVIRRQADSQVEDINPMQLLGLPEATRFIERIRTQQPAQALVLALVRLLVPCLEYRGNRRHLVVEEWGAEDLRGEALFAGTRTEHARDLAAEQAEQYRVVTSGESPPAGSLAEIFWTAHTELPWLPEAFEDENLRAFAKALYFDFCSRGGGRIRGRCPRTPVAN